MWKQCALIAALFAVLLPYQPVRGKLPVRKAEQIGRIVLSCT